MYSIPRCLVCPDSYLILTFVCNTCNNLNSKRFILYTCLNITPIILSALFIQHTNSFFFYFRFHFTPRSSLFLPVTYRCND